MARRGFRPRGISESQRRKKSWITVKTLIPGAAGGSAVLFTTSIEMEIAATTASPGANSQDIFGLVSDALVEQGEEESTLPEECTILRARGSLQFSKNTGFGAAGSVEDQYNWGFGVTDIRGITQGVVPLPVTDGDWDGWMFLRQSASPPLDSEGTIVDVKVMRKIKTGDALFFAAQSVNGGSTATPIGQWIFDMRLLILFP